MLPLSRCIERSRLVKYAVCTAHPALYGTFAQRDNQLTPQQWRVLALMVQGDQNKQIAYKLGVGEATVKSHINRIFTKTGCRDRAQAVQYAFTHGYADPGAK